MVEGLLGRKWGRGRRRLCRRGVSVNLNVHSGGGSWRTLRMASCFC